MLSAPLERSLLGVNTCSPGSGDGIAEVNKLPEETRGIVDWDRTFLSRGRAGSAAGRLC
jgi:hypothetical protein